ncbi:DNA-binding domain-containing protein [Rickettsiales bacterium]|nr:DNA-binding domain-containing protein [Rickettsiales bacterium]
MTSLKKIQQNFINDILDEKLSTKDYFNSKYISAKSLIGIYQDSCIGNILSPMKMTFPAVEKTLGKEFFDFTCREYIKKNPPRKPNMYEYGSDFPDFLDNFEPVGDLEYIANLARLECLYQESIFCDKSPSFDVDKFSKILPDDYSELKFTLNPSTRFFSCDYKVFHKWHVSRKDMSGELDNNFKKDDNIKLMLTRPDMQVNVIILKDCEYNFLDKLSNNNNLYQAFDSATDINENFDLVTNINKYIQMGVLVDFSLDINKK